MPTLLFAHGMQVEVPEATVLRFHPTSLSPYELSCILTVEFHVAGIIFVTKEAVLEKVPGTFFSSNIHTNRTPDNIMQIMYYRMDNIMQIMNYRLDNIMHCARVELQKDEDQSMTIQREIENSDRLEFFPLIFDYMRRKHDFDDDENAAVMPYTLQLSLAQAQHFYQVFDYWLPGVFVSNEPPLGLNILEENRMTLILAEKEFVRNETYTSCTEMLQVCTQNNDSDDFCFFLLQHVNRLSVGRRRLEHFLLSEFCAIDPTHLRLCMLATLFDSNEFGGRFFSVNSNAHYPIFENLVQKNFASVLTKR